MLTINKVEPSCFISFKKKNNPKNYEKDCDHVVRKCLRDALFTEQNAQCFYCEQKIENDSKKVHIEHFIPRDANLKNTDCDYNNLFLSCNGKEHCGTKKGNAYDEDKHLRIYSLTKALEDPSIMFDYTTQGIIKAKNSLSKNEKERATNTIELLGLNHKDLVATRENIFLQLEMYKTYGYKIDEIYTFFNEFENLFKGY